MNVEPIPDLQKRADELEVSISKLNGKRNAIINENTTLCDEIARLEYELMMERKNQLTTGKEDAAALDALGDQRDECNKQLLILHDKQDVLTDDINLHDDVFLTIKKQIKYRLGVARKEYGNKNLAKSIKAFEKAAGDLCFVFNCQQGGHCDLTGAVNYLANRNEALAIQSNYQAIVYAAHETKLLAFDPEKESAA